jgi:hypothetical protein
MTIAIRDPVNPSAGEPLEATLMRHVTDDVDRELGEHLSSDSKQFGDGGLVDAKGKQRHDRTGRISPATC